MAKRLIFILFTSSLALLAVLVGAVYSLVVFLGSMTTLATFNSRSIHLALSGAFLVGAVALYAVKKSRALFAYGLLEVAVGLVSNWKSLDIWSHPVSGSGLLNILWARLAMLAGGIYLIGRGVSNILDGFDRLVPIPWPETWASLNEVTGEARHRFKEAYDAPSNIRVPTSLLKYQIAALEEEVRFREQEAVVAAEANLTPVQGEVDDRPATTRRPAHPEGPFVRGRSNMQLLEELEVARARFEEEVLNATPKKRSISQGQ